MILMCSFKVVCSPSHPNGAHAREAATRLADLSWSAVNQTDLDAVRRFVRDNPDNPHRSDAQRILDKFEADQKDRLAQEREKQQKLEQAKLDLAKQEQAKQEQIRVEQARQARASLARLELGQEAQRPSVPAVLEPSLR